jgi:hypothetical protein
MKKFMGLSAIIFLFLFSFVWMAWAQEPDQKKEESKKGFGMTLGPSSIRLQGGAGQTQSATVRVWNNGSTPITVVHELSDVANQVGQDGNLVRTFLPPGSVPASCAKWISVQDQEFVLGPGDYRDVTFLISPPADVSGSKAGVIFFRGIPVLPDKTIEADKPTTTVQVQPRLGVLVFYEAQGTIQRTGKLQNLFYESPVPAAGQPLKIIYEFENTGNADILLSGTFYILDQNKALVAKGDLTPIRTFPGDKGSAQTVWSESIAPGKYQLVVTLELGPDAQESIVREFEFSVT